MFTPSVEELSLLKSSLYLFVVNVGDYIQAVLDRNLAENISRVLYPNDNVRVTFPCSNMHNIDWNDTTKGSCSVTEKRPPDQRDQKETIFF